jgi:phosphoribosylanthranilate isomerase
MSVEVKICGMTNRDDVLSALEAGADYVGFVLYGKSPRGIPASRMREILDGLDAPCRAVGVFVNEPRAAVAAVAADCGLYAVQLHGDELPGDFASFPHRLWRAVRLGAAAPAVAPEEWKAERYVVDAAVPGVYGGTGVPADWERAAALAAQHAVILAGGLTVENVERAIAAVHPAGVDVSSGVESEPGRKDRAKVAKFIANVKRHE